MKVVNMSSAIALSLGLLATGSASAEFKCDRQQLTRVDATACAKAAQGIDELARHVQRTRMVHGLYIMDYVRPANEAKQATAPAPEPVKVAATPR